MPDYTSNYNLIKPDESEYYDINQFNSNMDTIDTVLKTQSDDLSSDYLPLSAGSGKKLTGNLYLNSDNPHYYLQYEGVNKGNISYNLDTVYNIALYNNEGLSLRLYDNGDVTLNGNGNGSIKLRPNNSNTGQLTVSNTGRVDITGDVYLNKGTSESAEYFQYNGVTKGQIYTSGSTGEYPTIHIASINNGTVKSSVSLNSNAGYIVATGTDIYLRPVYNSTEYQVLLSHSGTHTINGSLNVTGVYNTENKSVSFSSPVSISAGGNVKVATITGLTPGHMYMLVASHVRVYDRTSASGYVYLNFYRGDKASTIAYDYHSVPRTAGFLTGMCVVSATSEYTSMTLYVESDVACKATGYFEAYRIR